MGDTVIKRVENRTSTTVKLYDTERQNDPDNGAPIGPGETRAVDMTVPWAPYVSDFEAHHLELQVNDQPRYWIWQANNDDGDYVRFATTEAWRTEARHVHGYAGAATNLAEAIGGAVFEGDTERLGQMFLGERAIVVLNSHFELVPLAPKPPPPNITAIKRVENRSSTTVQLLDKENDSVPGHEVPIGPGETLAVDMWVPFARSASEFNAHHLELRLNGTARYWIWQVNNDDGDYVRFATTGAWRTEATPVRGVPAVGVSPADWVFTGDRTLVVTNTEFELWPTPGLVDSLLDPMKALEHPYWMCDEKPPDPTPSVPKKSAVAFSMAGHPSDAYKQGQRGARYLYRDSGKRYEFSIGEDGQIDAMHPDGTRTPIDKVFSYSRVRSGEFVAPPPFDLVAASGGRVFAKAKDSDQFYFATMDHMFIHAPKEDPMDALEFDIPSTHFKLDPEFNQPEANSADLLEHIDGIFIGHPASERFPLFSRVLDKQVMDFMIAPLKPETWHPLDSRPPQDVLAVPILTALDGLRTLALATTQLALGLGPLTLLVQVAWWTLFKDRVSEAVRRVEGLGSAPPPEFPTYTPVTYCREDGKEIAPPVINYEKVLDIGVGHIHHHQQYELITHPEIQPILRDNVASGYRFFNGPVSDGDGYIDGTCNFYALVKLKSTVQRPVAYALLFQDEQSFFTQRWRLVDPDDNAGLSLALTTDLAPYGWEPDKYWCPFRNGHIDERSRLAVAGQVLLVTGVDPASNVARIYSINFSWSTIDRTWRWRPLPNGTAAEYFEDDAAAAEEQITPDLLDHVYPQTIRLRDDMTIHLKGTRSMMDKSIDPVGRWYQRYLPATNQLVPLELSPENGYTHAWKYLPEDVFQRADQFSHFGVYDTVDSRTQYYVVEPTSEADADTLEKIAKIEKEENREPGPWADDAHQLYVSQWKFRWEEPRHLGVDPFDSPSLFNPGPRLRIVKRGSRWIAMHWDKRDDDLLPFDGPYQDDGSPVPVELKNGDESVWVTLHSHRLVEEPPVVQTVYFWWEPADKPGDPRAVIRFDSPREQCRPIQDELESLEAQLRDLQRQLHEAVPEGKKELIARIDVKNEEISDARTRLNECIEQFGLPGVFEPVWRVRMAAFDLDAADEAGEVVRLLDLVTEGHFTRTADGFYEYRWTPMASEQKALKKYASSSGEMKYGTSIWFEDIVGHVSGPEQISWPPQSKLTIGAPQYVLAPDQT